jgi:small-conductance mechanosensitive channel
MEAYHIQFFETVLVFIGYIITYYLTKTFINNSLKKADLHRGRRKITIKAVNLFSLLTSIVLLSAIWGLEQNEIALFVGSVLTALGIAFFAQWSLLSNITASLILIFNHPLKIGDTIKILDKEYPFEGQITDLTYFFIYLKTDKKGETITIPNSLLLQKSVSILEKKQSSKESSK